MPADNMPAGRPKASFLHEPMLIVLSCATLLLLLMCCIGPVPTSTASAHWMLHRSDQYGFGPGGSGHMSQGMVSYRNEQILNTSTHSNSVHSNMAAFRLGLAHGLASKAVDPRGHMFQDCTVPFLVQSVRMQPYEPVTCVYPKGTLVTVTTVDAAFGLLFGMTLRYDITQLVYVAKLIGCVAIGYLM